MHERRRLSNWSTAARYSGALGLFVCLGLVTVNAQQPDFTGVWTNYVEPGQGRGGGAATLRRRPGLRKRLVAAPVTVLR